MQELEVCGSVYRYNKCDLGVVVQGALWLCDRDFVCPLGVYVGLYVTADLAHIAMGVQGLGQRGRVGFVQRWLHHVLPRSRL